MIDILFTQHTTKATISKFYSKNVVLKSFVDGKYAFHQKISKLEKVSMTTTFVKHSLFRINHASRKS